MVKQYGTKGILILVVIMGQKVFLSGWIRSKCSGHERKRMGVDR